MYDTVGEYVEDVLAGKKQFAVDLIKELAAEGHTRDEIVSMTIDCIIEALSSVFPNWANYFNKYNEKLYFLEFSFVENSLKNLLDKVFEEE